MQIRIGTRASKLAMIQANIVATKLSCQYEIIPITTSGDKDLTKTLYDIGGKALFIKELEDALLADKIDIAVHSLKDMPGILPKEFVIAAMLEREDPRDALVSKLATKISDLPNGAIIGTSSPRRMAYLKALHKNLKIVNLRGNVDSRVAKIISGELDAAVLSYAGLKRLGIAPSDICTPIDPSEMIPAIGQGVIAIETLAKKKDICSHLNHKITFDLMQAERAYLEHLGADCKTPVAAYARMENDEMMLDFMMAQNGLSTILERRLGANVKDAYKTGKLIAEWMKGHED